LTGHETARARRWFLLATAIGCALWAAVVVGRFDGPLIGYGDVGCWEYTGFHLAEHWRWWPLPHVELQTDAILFPFGTTAALQPWGLERDLLYAALSGLFGTGPWLQLYFLFSLAVTAIGLFAILGRRYGRGRAAVVALTVAFLNHYLARKFPFHLSLVTVHWLQLGVAVDLLLADTAWQRERIPVRLWVGRATLLVLAMGLELGYIAGLALTSALLTAVFVAASTLLRCGDAPMLGRLVNAWTRGRRELRTDPRARLFAAVGSVAALLLLPTVVGIVYDAMALEMSDAVEMRRAPSGWRLLLPYFPGLHPGSHDWAGRFADLAESDVELSPGWTFLALAIGGSATTPRRRLGALLPTALLLLLLLTWDPVERPTLNTLPWFRFARTPGRISALLPLLLALPILTSSLRISARRGRLLAAGWIALALLEAGVGLSLPRGPFHRIDAFTAEQQTYMNAVRDAPGEAVLDWPPCIASGSTEGRRWCRPIRLFNAHSWRRFHGKKSLGAYLGRFSRQQLRPLAETGLAMLARPDPIDRGGRQKCLSDAELDYLGSWLADTRYAGLQVYAGALAGPACVEQLAGRFGAPIASTILPGAGEVLFIPRPPDLGRSPGPPPAYSPPRPVELDLLDGSTTSPSLHRGFSRLEFSGGKAWRWATAKRAGVSFNSARQEVAVLRWQVECRAADQQITIRVDGAEELARHRASHAGELWSGQRRVPLGTGPFAVTLEHSSLGRPPHAADAMDPRTFAARWLRLSLTLTGEAVLDVPGSDANPR